MPLILRSLVRASQVDLKKGFLISFSALAVAKRLLQNSFIILYRTLVFLVTPVDWLRWNEFRKNMTYQLALAVDRAVVVSNVTSTKRSRTGQILAAERTQLHHRPRRTSYMFESRLVEPYDLSGIRTFVTSRLVIASKPLITSAVTAHSPFLSLKSMPCGTLESLIPSESVLCSAMRQP